MIDATVHLFPARPDVVVRDPVTRAPLAPEGEAKPLDTYWSRRLVDGDVLVQAPAEAPVSRAQSRLKAVPPPAAPDAT